ncbi:MAG TPA: 2-dehydropantoate 2-reductase [Hyphomicrobiaceae bacterium]|jgi:2-dehydropantoate 2-reductase
MRILIVGAGAIGGWLAGVLWRGGAEVALLARGAALETIRARGLALIDGERRETFTLPVSDTASDLSRPDAVVLAVKTYTFAEAAAAAAPALHHGPLLVTAMNGLPWWFLDGLAGPLDGAHLDSVDPRGQAAALLTGVRPVAGVVHASTRVEAPGVVRVVATDRLILGEPRGGTSAHTAELARLVAAGGVACPLTPDIRSEIWAKLWGNASLNPVSAIVWRSAHGILGEPRLLALVHDLMAEFARVGDRLGLRLPMTVEERMAVTRKLGDFRTSMLNDAEAGRPIEVEGLLGVVVELAEKLGEPVPASRAVYALARGLGRPAAVTAP